MNNHKCNWPSRQANGNWKCRWCSKIFRTRAELNLHKKEVHPKYLGKNRIAWNTGLSKYTNESLAQASRTYKMRLQTGEIVAANLGRHHSDEEKQKISNSMKAYFKQNPDKVFYRRLHSSKENYAENYFAQILKDNNIQFQHNFHVLTYFLDFAIINKKIDIEIDGAQHHNDKAIVKHDLIRNKQLIDHGWKIIRIYWPDWKKQTTDNKQKYIQKLLNLINSDNLQELSNLL